MTLTPLDYVPVLQLKAAEKAALRELAPEVISSIAPLFHLVPKRAPQERLATHLGRCFEQLGLSVRDLKSYFIDPEGLGLPSEASATQIYNECALQGGPPFIPVVRTSRPTEVGAALRFARRGIALRLTRQDFEKNLRFSDEVTRFVRSHSIKMKDTDLLVDLGSVGSELRSGLQRMTSQILDELPSLDSWRSFTLLSNSFPTSMTVVQPDSELVVPREDFVAWTELAADLGRQKKRVPTFGDGGIQHAEPFTATGAPITPPRVIRYARRTDWLLVKGHSRDDPFAEQMPLLARRLIDSRQFLGQEHCPGCRQIAATAADEGGLDNKTPQAWRRIGMIHHITTTVKEIQSQSDA